MDSEGGFEYVALAHSVRFSSFAIFTSGTFYQVLSANERKISERGNDLPLFLADIAAVPLQVAEDNFDYDDCCDGDDEAEWGDHAFEIIFAKFSARSLSSLLMSSSISLNGKSFRHL